MKTVSSFVRDHVYWLFLSPPQLITHFWSISVGGGPFLRTIPYIMSRQSTECPYRRFCGDSFVCKCFSDNNDLEYNKNFLASRNSVTKSRAIWLDNLVPEIQASAIFKAMCRIGEVESVEVFREGLIDVHFTPQMIIDQYKSHKEIFKERKFTRAKEKIVAAPSPVYACVVFNTEEACKKALHPAVRSFGLILEGRDCRTHPYECTTLLVRNYPNMEIADLDTILRRILSRNGKIGFLNASLVRDKKARTKTYMIQKLPSASNKYSTVMLDFPNSASCHSAFQTLSYYPLLANNDKGEWDGLYGETRGEVDCELWRENSGDTIPLLVSYNLSDPAE